MFYKRNLTTTFKGYPSITEDVAELIAESGIKDGYCIVSIPHTTAGLAITSFWDSRGMDDMMDEIDRNIPARVTYKHQDSPYDAAGHVKSAMMGNSAMLIIKDGKMILGSSQGLCFIEFDGPRPREYYVKLVEVSPAMFLKKFNIKTKYMEMYDITEEIKEAVAESGVAEGLAHVSMLHSTAGIVVASKDSSASCDVMSDIEKMVPTRADFKHTETASDAGGHVKTALTGSQLSLIVSEGKLVIGEDQAVYFAEFDGPRPRSFFVGVHKGGE
jgi:secondary thiamine-phosphate synthase enzyme